MAKRKKTSSKGRNKVTLTSVGTNLSPQQAAALSKLLAKTKKEFDKLVRRYGALKYNDEYIAARTLTTRKGVQAYIDAGYSYEDAKAEIKDAIETARRLEKSGTFETEGAKSKVTINVIPVHRPDKYKAGSEQALLAEEQIELAKELNIPTTIGTKISLKNYLELQRAIDEANENIRQVKENLPESIHGTFPDEINFNEVIEQITDDSSARREVKRIKESFTTDKISNIITQGNDIMTQAEKDYYQSIVDEENLKRQSERQEKLKSFEETGLLTTNDEFYREPIVLDKYSRSGMRAKALAYTDANLERRANIWRQNFLKMIDKMGKQISIRSEVSDDDKSRIQSMIDTIFTRLLSINSGEELRRLTLNNPDVQILGSLSSEKYAELLTMVETINNAFKSISKFIGVEPENLYVDTSAFGITVPSRSGRRYRR